MRFILYHIIIILLFNTSCGFNGDQKLSTNNSTQTISINFGFLTQIEGLCRDQLLRSSYTTDELYNQAVASCVFSNLTLLNPAQLQALQQNCRPGADLSGYTPDQIASIRNSCVLMGF